MKANNREATLRHVRASVKRDKALLKRIVKLEKLVKSRRSK